MSTRPAAFAPAAFALAASLAALVAASPGRAAETPPVSKAGYFFDAEHVHGGVRWGYASLYRAPVAGGSFEGCRWMSVPTAYGIRYRPACGADAM